MTERQPHGAWCKGTSSKSKKLHEVGHDSYNHCMFIGVWERSGQRPGALQKRTGKMGMAFNTPDSTAG